MKYIKSKKHSRLIGVDKEIFCGQQKLKYEIVKQDAICTHNDLIYFYCVIKSHKILFKYFIFNNWRVLWNNLKTIKILSKIYKIYNLHNQAKPPFDSMSVHMTSYFWIKIIQNTSHGGLPSKQFIIPHIHFSQFIKLNKYENIVGFFFAFVMLLYKFIIK